MTPTTGRGMLISLHGAIGLIAVAACSVWLAACGRGGAPAGAGDEPRYVVLSPALAVMLRDLGHEDRIVARHAHDLVLDESLPVAGELGRIDYEVLIAAEPTHVLIEWGGATQALPERLTELADDRGFDVQRFSMLTLADIRAAVDRLERDLPPAERGPDEGYWQGRMDQAWNAPATSPGGRPRFGGTGRILLVAGTDPVIAVTGPGSWHHQILEAVGGNPAISQGGPWMELSTEDVLRLAPDGIILIQPRGRDEPPGGLGADAAEIERRLGPLARLNIPAIDNARVALIDDPLAHTPSTAMVGLTQRVESILAAWTAAAERSSVIPGLGETP
jgi:ABC-type Fe3+-hydroxamate transport system substrate-binding protein